MKKRIGLLPGIIKDDSELVARTRFVRADKIRFNRGLAETIGGWEPASSTVMGDAGVTRGILTYADNSRNKWAALGSDRGLWAMDTDGTLYDITPVIERGELSSAFATVNGSTLVEVRDDAHGLIATQKVKLTATSSVANLTIDGEFYVSSVLTSSTYTITTSSANATSSGQGGTIIDYEYFLQPGNLHSLSALGYGTGPYSGGGYSQQSSASALDARTWSLAPWGQNLLTNCPGKQIFEWAPNTSNSELVTNGNMSSSVGWTQGSGWTVDGTQASAVTASTIQTSVTCRQGAWHLLDFDVSTVAASNVSPMLGTSSIGAAITSAGTYKRAFFSGAGGSQTLKFDGHGAFTGKLDNVSVKVLKTGHPLPSPAPQTANGVFVTPERIAGAWGIPDENGNTDPLRIGWSDQENNLDWNASAGNVAGYFVLSHGSRVQKVIVGNGENLVGTDTAAYSMRFVPNPAVVYRFDLIGSGCGFAGPNAGTQLNGLFYWVTDQGEFYRYAGGTITPLQCPLSRHFKDNLSPQQKAKIYAFAISAKEEIWWIYPDVRDGLECSRYIIHNVLEPDPNAAWCEGTFDRSAMADAGIFEYVLATDLTGKPWYHEKSDSSAGSPRDSYLESGWFDINDGDSHIAINGIIPDFEGLMGGLTITLKTRLYPNDPNERTYGPKNVTGATQKIDFRAQGRQAKIIVEASDAPSWWRWGALAFEIEVTGVRR